MKIDGNELAILQNDLDRRGQKQEAWKIKQEFLKQVRESGESYELGEEYMVIGTSAIVDTEIDGAVGMNSGIFNNPFIIWGKYHKGLFRTTLKLSFQFHHTQMDGAHAGRFLQRLQENIFEIRKCR